MIRHIRYFFIRQYHLAFNSRRLFNLTTSTPGFFKPGDHITATADPNCEPIIYLGNGWCLLKHAVNWNDPTWINRIDLSHDEPKKNVGPVIRIDNSRTA